MSEFDRDPQKGHDAGAQQSDQQADSDGHDAEAPTVHHQARFTADGDVSTDGEVTATSLGDFGVDVDDQERETRIAQPQASEFGIDDRPCVTSREDGDQATLFADVDADQRTLTGGQASQQFQFREGQADD